MSRFKYAVISNDFRGIKANLYKLYQFPALPEYIVQLSCSWVAKVSSGGFDPKKCCYFPRLFNNLQADSFLLLTVNSLRFIFISTLF